MKKTVIIRVASRTHTGYVRDHNEDNLFLSRDKRVFAVADGMGGMDFGELAAALSVKAVERLWKAKPPDLVNPDAAGAWVAEAIESANADVMKESFSRGLDMGTTLVLVVLVQNRICCYGHLGDSRLYLSTKGCLTEDHAIGAYELTNFVGRSLTASPDLASVACERGSCLLLCTDGLNKVVCDEDIMHVISNYRDPEKMVDLLTSMALECGGPDNITTIAIRYV
jgi:serine/threonine protein phosphatase PrpC